MQNEMTGIFSRNKGLISDVQQGKLAEVTVAIAGVGGDGGLLAERLVRLGIGKLILADPEVFEMANMNRQFACNKYNLGKNKAYVVAKELQLINPDLNIKIFTEGITEDNIKEIVWTADVIVDELEYSLPELSVMLHREARQQNKYVFMGANIGWGASIFCFTPESKTFEEHFCYNEDTKTITCMAYLKDIPSYLSNEMVESVLSGKIPMPSVSSSVSLVASVLANEIVFHITGIRQAVTMPEYLYIDLYDLSITKS